MNHPLAMIDSDDTNDEESKKTIPVENGLSVGLIKPSSRLLNLRDSSPSQVSLSSTDQQQQRRSSPVVGLDSKTIALANIIRSKCAEKRMAPKPPVSSLMSTGASASASASDNSSNVNSEFLIPVEMVRWFYKTEKEKHHNHQEQTPATSSGSLRTSNGSVISNDTPIDSNNNTSTIGNKITVV